MGSGCVWTPEMVALLGTMSDRNLAQHLGRSMSTVVYARVLRRIPAFQVQRRWLAQELELFGSMPDAEVARLVGRRRDTVRAMRVVRGVKGAEHGRIVYLCWDEVERDFTTSHTSATELSVKHGVPAQRIRKKARARGWARPPRP